VTISRDTSFKPAREATVKPLDDRGVIVDMHTGKCWELNPIGFAIWTLVAEGKSVADTIAAISARYAVSAGTSETDVLTFLESLVNAGLLNPTPESGSADRTAD
jgi:hypothetical protein